MEHYELPSWYLSVNVCSCKADFTLKKIRFFFTELISNLTFNQTIKEYSPSWITALTWQRGLCKIMASSPITSWQTEGGKVEAVRDLILGGYKITADSDSALVAQMVKNLSAMQETRFRFLGREDPLEKGMATHSDILPGEFHEQKILAGYSPWSCKEWDMTEQLTLTCSLEGKL